MLPIFGVNEEITGQIRIQNPVKHPQWSPSAKITIGLNTLTISAKKPTADVRLNSKCTSDRMCCKCGVWVDCKCMEFVAAGWCTRKQLRLNQTKRNVLLWWFRNPALLIGLGIKGLKPDWKRLGSYTCWTGKGGEGVVCFRVCEAPLNDWANGGSGSVDDFYLYDKYGFSFKGSWSYFR